MAHYDIVRFWGNPYSSVEVGDACYICNICKCNRRRQPAWGDIEGEFHYLSVFIRISGRDREETHL